MTSKYFDALIEAVAEARTQVPGLELTIVGDGVEHDRLATLIGELDAVGWIHLVGHVSDAELLDLYQRSWLVASASMSEGWGMTLTEAAACGTPAVATRIPGHEDSVEDGVSGVLVERQDQIGATLVQLLNDPARLADLRAGALAHAGRFTWDRTAQETLAVLADQSRRRRRT